MDDKFVTIGVYETPVDAGFMKSLLQAEGIRAWLADEQTVALNWDCNLAIGGIKLQVSEEDAGRALTIIEGIAHRPETPGPPPEECGEADLGEERRDGKT